ncbi:hypothetical protein [Streptomyces sp. NPDC057910]|uniref:hypothetical protein n=1 Tax=Streptomyces sp. NPDC057910 TaxID=3346278 RepID=UPI0036EB9254
MKITIEGASPAFEEKLLRLVAEHRHELAVTQDPGWNEDRAELFLRSTTEGARALLLRVVDGGGWADAEELRAELDSFRGATIALSRALQRGARQGHWPENTPAPAEVVYDEKNPSWQRAQGYHMSTETLAAFQVAFDRLTL